MKGLNDVSGVQSKSLDQCSCHPYTDTNIHFHLVRDKGFVIFRLQLVKTTLMVREIHDVLTCGCTKAFLLVVFIGDVAVVLIVCIDFH